MAETADTLYKLETLLNMPGANMRAYSPATVMAEKFQAIVALGAVKSRMKDYYDLCAIPRAISVTHGDLKAAIEATFAQRQTDIPATAPPGLIDAFSGTSRAKLFLCGF